MRFNSESARDARAASHTPPVARALAVRTLAKNPDGKAREKPASNVAARRAPEGWCASRGGVDASGRYAGSMTERVPGDSTRRAPTLAAARPSREHPSWVMRTHRPRARRVHSLRRSSIGARATSSTREPRRAADGAMRIRTAFGHLSRVLHGSCDTSRSKEGNGPSVSRFSNRVRVQTHSASSGFRKSGQIRITAYRGTKHAFECIKIASIYQQTCYSSPHLRAVRFAPA